MKALQLTAQGGIESLKLVNLPDPGAPTKGEIRVRLHASSLNRHDLGVCTKKPLGRETLIPMSDGAGIVEAVGKGVKDFKKGDKVVSCFFPLWHKGEPNSGSFATVPGDGIDGMAREVIVAPQTSFTKAPKGWSHAEAATLTTAGLTAYRALVVNGGIKKGDKVLALGTGGVSIFALQMAKKIGAQVAITSSDNNKLAQAKKLGADFTVNYNEDPDWGKAVAAWSKTGVDHVIEVGGSTTLMQSIAACRLGGHIALIGGLSGWESQLRLSALAIKQIKLHGFIVGSRTHQQQMVKALDKWKLRPTISKSFPLENLADAFAFEQAGKHFGKICVEF